MTETTRAFDAIRPSYEAIRDELPIGEDANGPRIGTLWRSADRWRSALREEYETIYERDDLSDQGKEELCEAARERMAPRIQKDAAAARAKAVELAKKAHGRSIPMPDNRTLGGTKVDDTNTLTAIQLKASAIQNRVAMLRDNTPAFKKGSTIVRDTLRDEYANAMDATGIEAFVAAKAVLEAADALGVSREAVYSPYQNRMHLEAAEEARRMQLVAGMIPGERQVPRHKYQSNNPFGASRGVGGSDKHTKSSSLKAFIPKGGKVVPASGAGKRRPSWK
jgi:hypothetical protein